MLQTVGSLINWLSVPVLMTAAMLSRFAVDYELLADVTMCLAAVALTVRAVRSKENFLAAGHAAVAVAVSPLLLVVRVFLLMGFFYVAALLTLSVAFRTQPVRAELL
jgi:hypothetical protein